MADQVNPTVSLAPGTLLALTVARPTPPVQEKPPIAPPASAQAPKPEAGGRPVSPEAVRSAAEAFSEFLQSNRSDLEFQVDKATGEPYFKIVNTTTKEVIRQVPSEEVLAMARKLRELADAKGAPGVLVDKEG